jgi:hypothetical protein
MDVDEKDQVESGQKLSIRISYKSTCQLIPSLLISRVDTISTGYIKQKERKKELQA